MNKNLIDFLFGESVIRQEIEDAGADFVRLFEQAAEVEDAEAQTTKAPLESALSSIGISGKTCDDPAGACLSFDDRDAYSEAINKLSEPDAVQKLAELGWVASKCGDVAMSGEPADYKIRFLEIKTAEGSDNEKAEKAKSIAKAAREFATTELDRESDELNPVETDDKGGGKRTGVGKPSDGKDPEGSIKDSASATQVADRLLEMTGVSAIPCVEKGFCPPKKKAKKKLDGKS